MAAMQTEQNSAAAISSKNILDESPLQCDQLLSELKNLYPTLKTTAIPDSLVKSINDMNKRALSSNEPSKKLYDFSRMKVKEKKLRIVTQTVPEGILPKEYTANLYDVKVGGHGPDDKIYNDNVDIRNSIPRGTTLMSLQKEGEKDESIDVVLYANKKFTGGVGDEDETQPENNEIWHSYCLNNTDEADKVVVMDKLNGEAAHLSGRFIDGKFYIITGSKNVHMLLSCEEDIGKYEGDRYRIAIAIAKAVWKQLTRMKEKSRHILFNLLHHTKCTVVFEILQPENQHIVNLTYLKEPELNFVCVTPTVADDSNSETSLTALPPHHCLELFESLGFVIAPYEIIERNHVDKFTENSRKLVDKEGHVLYYILKTDGYENTIGMAKIKTIWYVLLRALREKAVFCFTTAKKKNGWSLEDRILSTHKRFKEIQAWLKFSDEILTEWKEMSKGFMQWLNEEINNNRVTGANIRPQFPTIIDNFQKSKGTQLPQVK